jgi:peptidoglycan hydrolase-like protein with peptidoglycan-binding domain
VPEYGQRSGRRRARVLALLVLGAAVVAGAAVVVTQLGSPSKGTGRRAALPPGTTTTTVTRQTLVDHQSVSGTLGYGDTIDLYDRLAGTFTWLPGVGTVIERGQVVCRLDNRPVFLMYGDLPAYRTLKLGVSDGPDVAELNDNLRALGFDPYGAIAAGSRHFSAATAAAVKRFQDAKGMSKTGVVELGRVLFAPSARRITAVRVVLGSTAGSGGGGGGGGGNGKPSNSSDSSAPDVQFASASSTRARVQVQLDADKQQLAHVGERAPVTLPDGRRVGGVVSSVGTVATAAGGGGGSGGSSATIPVTVTLDRPVARLDQAPVNVDLTRSRRRNVLAVPATALVATAGGGYALVALDGGRRVELPVTPGLFAGGYVEISGAGVHEGLTVTESQ